MSSTGGESMGRPTGECDIRTFLSSQDGLIFRITHRKNLDWILRHGLHCSSSIVRDRDFVSIGSGEIIGRRAARLVPIHPGGALSDYIPFYFTPWSPMLYNIVTGHHVEKVEQADIVLLVSSVNRLRDRAIRFVFTERHALVAYSRFFQADDDLSVIDWGLLRRRDFSRDPEDPDKLERYQAELLVHRFLPVDALTEIACYNENVRMEVAEKVERAEAGVTVCVREDWFF